MCVCVCVLCGRVFRMVDRKRRYGRDLDSLDTLGMSAKKKRDREKQHTKKKTENCFEKKKKKVAPEKQKKKIQRATVRAPMLVFACRFFFSPKLMTGQMPKRMRRDERRRRESNGREKTYK